LADSLTESVGAVTLRAIRPGDLDFLLDLYGSTREDELGLLQWAAPEWASFIGQQFAAQDRHYRASYPDGRFEIVELGGSPVGRLYVVRLPDQLHIIDIALMPSYRGRGIGSTLLAALLAEADEAGVAVTLHVRPHNRARRLYERLGFLRRGDVSVYEFMERPAHEVS
jgi:ribosomal protein S18 acetylase RimI-like enzyme